MKAYIIKLDLQGGANVSNGNVVSEGKKGNLFREAQ